MPSRLNPSSGIPFHSLHATSHALQPMQTLVSVKKPIRSAMVTVAFLDTGAAPVRGEVGQDRRAGGAAARPDVAGADLALLDEHVGVQRDGEQVVGRVAGHQAGEAPVVRQPDLVHDAVLHAQRGEPVVTSTRASMTARAVTTCAQPRLLRPRSAASAGETSMNISGCSSDRYGSVRLIPPAVWCSVSRLVVNTYGNTVLPSGWIGFSGRSYTLLV